MKFKVLDVQLSRAKETEREQYSIANVWVEKYKFLLALSTIVLDTVSSQSRSDVHIFEKV